jgi:hypothetical protein
MYHSKAIARARVTHEPSQLWFVGKASLDVIPSNIATWIVHAL